MRRRAAMGALGCGLAVLLGAFAAHGLKERLGTHGQEIWQTGVRYQFLHSLALLWLGTLARPLAGSSLVSTLWITGIALFSGSLYGLALGGGHWLGPLTPLGGLCFIAGWGVLVLKLWRQDTL
ncbi:MAG: DUF423 domain-containing protein [Candidatus Cloacimonetes bacterium]|nr:DUF423 domain-containing protein [Candidatus Cloacimonadota bacterium]